MSQASGSSPVVERLLGRENWNTWKFGMQTYLETEELWEAVEPNLKADGTPEAVPSAKDRKARGKIILGVDPSLYVHVQGTKTAKEAWNKLEQTYEDNGLTRRWGLLHKLMTTNLANSASMEAYVTRMVATANQLGGVGFPISEEWVGMLLLAGLPQTYKPMVMALQNSGAAITGDLIKTKLLQEDHEPTEAVEPAFAVKSKSSYKQEYVGNQQSKGKGPKCHSCHKFGHIARDCPAKSSSKPPEKKDGRRSGRAFGAVLTTTNVMKTEEWFFDSGASCHLTRTKALLRDVHQAEGKMFAANKGEMQVIAEGTAVLHPVGGEEIDVNRVQLIPELAVNLLSVGKIVDGGHTVVFRQTGCEVLDEEGTCIATGSRSEGLFKLEQDAPKVLAVRTTSIELWHKRTGHLSIKNLTRLRNGLVTGVEFQGPESSDCKVCPMGRQTRLPFNKNGTRATVVLELVHSDVCGPMEQASIGGSRYFITFVDDYTRKMFIYFLRQKSEEEVTRCFKDFHAMAERQTGKKLKVLRTDNGTEYKNKGFEKLLSQLGIRHQTTVEYTPEQNGLAERANRTIVEKARCMLFEAKLPKTYWAEAAGTAVYLINRSPAAGIQTTPQEAWSGRKPDLSNLRVFGTTTMAHVPKQKRRKWDPKAIECILMGYDEETKGYRLYNVKSKQIFMSQDVTFIDEGLGNRSGSECIEAANGPQKKFVRLDFEEPDPEPAPIREPEPIPEPELPMDVDESSDESSDELADADDDVPFPELPDTSSDEEADDTVTLPALPPRQSSNPPSSPALRRSGRERAIPGKYNDFHVQCSGKRSSRVLDSPILDRPSTKTVRREDPASTAPPSSSNQRPVDDVFQHGLMLSDRGCPPHGKYSHVDVHDGDTGSDSPQLNPDDPSTHQEALARDDSNRWRRAMQEEYDALISNGTWEMTDLPVGRKAIRCKWVYKTKIDAAGKVDRYKARLVIKGYSQRKGVDYEETYSPVVRHSSLRYLFALAARMNLQIDQMDAITAFLQGELNEEIYMEQPPCFESDDRTKVCRLNKALYGLKQSSRVWNLKLDAALKKFGLTCSEYDPCVYYKVVGENVLFLALYVDDLLIFSNCKRWRKELKDQLCGEFRMKDLGPAKNVLGIRVSRTKDTVSLDQEAYVESVLARFQMSNCKPVATPMNATVNLTKSMGPTDPEEVKCMADVPYKEAVGCLMYLGQSTRPDICHAVNVLSRFNDNPGVQHWNAVKHLLRYLRGTAKLKLSYRKDGNADIKGYTDADWAADCEDRKSVTGYVFVAQGGAISWCSKRQQTVALSTCEAEYMALSAAVQEALWWKRLRARIEKDQPITIFCDNQSAIAVSKNGGFHARTKHIDIRHHFIKDTLERGDVDVAYIPTELQVADGLTKPIQKLKVAEHRAAMGLQDH